MVVRYGGREKHSEVLLLGLSLSEPLPLSELWNSSVFLRFFPSPLRWDGVFIVGMELGISLSQVS